MLDLFEHPDKEGYTPLADQMRPRTVEELVGQDHILGPGMPLRVSIESNSIPSIILWGPPGSGKTSIAAVIAKTVDAHFHWFSAVLSGVKELRNVIDIAKKQRRMTGKKTILFVDEIHRFNKAQQDAFLPHVEQGTITLVGATTENPSFEVISPLLSRAKVYVLNPITEDNLNEILSRTLNDNERGFGEWDIALDDDAREFIIRSSDGDARRMINTLEIVVDMKKTTDDNKSFTVALADVEGALQRKSLSYDKLGEEHYNIISAFIKSMRGSNPDAALYWMARMLEAGEEPLFVARRMVIFASEDIGNADPQAIQVAISAMQAFDFVGMPEGWIPLAQAATYLAAAPKSKSSYRGYMHAKKAVNDHGTLPVPMHLRNAPTRLMEDLGYAEGYKDPQRHKGNYVEQQYLPDKLSGTIYYEPTENGYERHISERLKKYRK